MAEDQKSSSHLDLPTLIRQFGEYFYELFNIRRGLDWIGTVSSIRNKVSLQGENIWMLICAIMIASVGLNLNSGAVIIGAMLVSPLMSPILGIGLGVGINDRSLLIKAVRSLLVATLFSILVSFIYFKFITPFKDPGSEIIGRTSPTVLDAIVALFGGTAGIVAVSRKDKGAAIPGVAIATALLPPLAVTGYGLATSNWEYARNSFYLFFLNSLLIAFATFLIVRFLGFPMKEHQTKEAKRKATFYIGAFVIASLVPGSIILREVLSERDRENKVNVLFNKNFDNGGNHLIGTVEIEAENQDTIIYGVTYRGKEISPDLIGVYQNRLSEINKKVSLIDPQFLDWKENELALLNSTKNHYNQKLSEQEQKEAAYQRQISSLQTEIKRLNQPYLYYSQFEKEIPALWPELDSFSFGKTYSPNQKDTTTKVDIKNTLFISWSDQLSAKEIQEKTQQVNRFLKTKLGEEHFIVIKH